MLNYKRDTKKDVGIKWVLPKVENCSCHISPPYSVCVENAPTVDEAIKVSELGPGDSEFETYVPYEQLVEAYSKIEELEK